MSVAAETVASADLSILMRSTAGCESVQQIINTAATAEALAVTILGVALESAANSKLSLDAEHKQALRAARAEEQAHYRFLTGSGAKPLTTTFSVPSPRIVTDRSTFFKALIDLEEFFIATYLAAAQEFAILDKPQLAEVALAVASVEAAHRVATRFFAIEAGILTGLPNDIGFQRAEFHSVGEAAAALRRLGYVGGHGARITYPGPGPIDNTGVKNLKP